MKISAIAFNVLMANLLLLLTSCASKPRGPLAYVSNERDDTITVIDTATDRAVSTIKVGARPRGIQLAPDQKTIWVALSYPTNQTPGEDKIAVIDCASEQVIAKYDAGTDPEQFVVNCDGTRLYIANEDAGTAFVTDVRTNKVIASIPVGLVLDTQTNQVIKTFLVGARPREAVFSGTKAYVTAENGNTISVIDSIDHKVINTIELPRGEWSRAVETERDCRVS
jgi:YVTN family beta-propeller protein